MTIASHTGLVQLTGPEMLIVYPDSEESLEQAEDFIREESEKYQALGYHEVDTVRQAFNVARDSIDRNGTWVSDDKYFLVINVDSEPTGSDKLGLSSLIDLISQTDGEFRILMSYTIDSFEGPIKYRERDPYDAFSILLAKDNITELSVSQAKDQIENT